MKRVIGPYVFEGGGAKSLNYQSLAKDLARATLEIPFNIPPYFALIARALGILEGDGSGNLRIKRMTRYEIKTGRSFFFVLMPFPQVLSNRGHIFNYSSFSLSFPCLVARC